MIDFTTQFNQFLGDYIFTDDECRNYPSHNIIKLSDNEIMIEMALAGFSKDDIEIDVTGDMLAIAGKPNDRLQYNYIFDGAPIKPFTRAFRLGDDVEVGSATMKDGILKIYLHNTLKYKSSRKVRIEDELHQTQDKQLLVEDPTL